MKTKLQEKWLRRTPGRNERKWELPSIYQAFPSTLPRQEWQILLPRGIPAFIFHYLIPQLMSGQTDHPVLVNTATSMGPQEAAAKWTSSPEFIRISGAGIFISFQLYFLSQDTNLSFWTRPSGTAINKTTLAMLFLGPHFHSSDFYWVHYLYWAGRNYLQKRVQLILNFCMFPHRKTPTIIYRQLCHKKTMAADTLIC